PAGFESGAILDADRRHAKRRLALRKRTRNASAGQGVAASCSCRTDRSFASQARRLRNHQLHQGFPSRSLSKFASGGERSAEGGWGTVRRRRQYPGRSRGLATVGSRERPALAEQRTPLSIDACSPRQRARGVVTRVSFATAVLDAG